MLNDVNNIKPETLKKLSYEYYKDQRFDLFKKSNLTIEEKINALEKIYKCDNNNLIKTESNNVLNIQDQNQLRINKINLTNKYKQFQVSKSSEGFYHQANKQNQAKSIKIDQSNSVMLLKKYSNPVINQYDLKFKNKLPNDLEKELTFDSFLFNRKLNQMTSTPLGSAVAFTRSIKKSSTSTKNLNLDYQKDVRLNPILKIVDNYSLSKKKKFLNLPVLI